MAHFKSLQMQLLDDLLWMGGGYVLKFSDRTFAEFFREEIALDIDDPKWSVQGGSKGKRMRCFLQTAPRSQVAQALNTLWDYRIAAMERDGVKESIADVHPKMAALMQSIGSTWKHGIPSSSSKFSPAVAVPSEIISGLISRFTALMAMTDVQRRGYAFETFLRDLFNTYGMEARDPFRIRGEQIDGSFQLEGSTYLLEAKWQNECANAAALRAFHGKVEEKAAWGRGLMISYRGFTENGLFAFGRGKKIVCMDGRDMYEALQHAIPLDRVIAEKARQAASNGTIFRRVSDLIDTLLR